MFIFVLMNRFLSISKSSFIYIGSVGFYDRSQKLDSSTVVLEIDFLGMEGKFEFFCKKIFEGCNDG